MGQSPSLDRTRRSEAITKPESLSDAVPRIRRNLFYFQVNYLLILALVFAVSLLSHTLSLMLLIAVIGAWLFLYILRPQDQQLVIFGRTFTNCETLIGLSLVTVVVILMTSVGSLLLSAFALGMALVCAHGAFRAAEDLFLDEQDTWPTGLSSFVRINGPASSIGIPVGPSAV